MIWQLHHQFPDGRTELKSELAFHGDDPDLVREWIKGAQADFPLPGGAVWLMLNENDPRFVRG